MGYVASEILQEMVQVAHDLRDPLLFKNSAATLSVAAHVSRRLKHDDWMALCLVQKAFITNPS
jgi:hypothetical protein